MSEGRNRRAFLVASGVTGTSLLLGCQKDRVAQATQDGAAPAPPLAMAEAGASEEPEVTATEDLMREHGVIRRALVVYREAGARLRIKPSAVPAEALQKAAKLLRSFAEDYHETQLEEAHIFPAIKRAQGAASSLVDTLVAQHRRGRQITDYVIASTGARMNPVSFESLARTLESFARMYEEHAALEDTIVFPAWKQTMSPKQLDEMGDRFEEIEHKTFGEDGFEHAVEQIAEIERAFGLDLGQFTAAPPPKA
jgi:hemerythrin-like domain-containing protein